MQFSCLPRQGQKTESFYVLGYLLELIIKIGFWPIYKGFFMEKNGPNLPDFKASFIEWPDFNDKF
jgi:hypothetical protein